MNRWAELYCILDRYFIKIDKKPDAASTERVLKCFGELYDYVDRQVYFYDHTARPRVSTPDP